MFAAPFRESARLWRITAGVAKLADATDLGSVAARRVGSIPIARTGNKKVNRAVNGCGFTFLLYARFKTPYIMKKSLVILFVALPALLFAQQKSRFGRLHYFKVSPTVLFPVDGNITPAAFGSLGVRVHRYAALGFSSGYFKFRHAPKPVVPIGVDVTITDFTSKKITPVFVGQLFYPTTYEIHTHESRSELVADYPVPNSYIYYNDYYDTKGKMMVQLGGGINLPLKWSKLLITGSYSLLNTKTTHLHTRHFSARGTQVTTTSKDGLSMWAFSASLVF